jgi:hypothetical protein
MSSHFNAIGFPVANIDQYWALARRAAAAGVRNAVPDGGAVVRWAVDAGPEIWSYVDRAGEVTGAVPFFSTGDVRRIAVTGAGDDPDEALEGWIDGWLEPTEDDEPYSGAFPVRVDVVNYALVRGRLTVVPSLQRIELIGLAHEADLYADERAYAAAPGDVYHLPVGAIASGPHLAADADVDTFTEATALLSGRLEAARPLTNAATGQPFWRLQLTLRGVRLHVFADRETLGGEPAAGQILAGGVWLLGRLV